MKQKIFLLILIVILIYLYPKDNVSIQPINSSDLRSTIVTADLKTNIIKSKNLVFCATISNALKAMENYLNSGTFKSISNKDEQLILKETENETIVQSYFKKNLEFAEPYEKLTNSIDFYINEDEIPVKGFGIENFDESSYKHKLLKNQFEIIYFSFCTEKTNKIIIKLLSKEDDEIILSTAFIGNTLQDSYEKIQNEINNNKKITFTNKSGHFCCFIWVCGCLYVRAMFVGCYVLKQIKISNF